MAAEALDCLVSIQNRLMKDNEMLLEHLKRVLRIQERDLGYESEEVLETLKKIVLYLDKLGKKAEKLSLQKRLSMLRMKFKQRIRHWTSSNTTLSLVSLVLALTFNYWRFLR